MFSAQWRRSSQHDTYIHTYLNWHEILIPIQLLFHNSFFIIYITTYLGILLQVKQVVQVDNAVLSGEWPPRHIIFSPGLKKKLNLYMYGVYIFNSILQKRQWNLHVVRRQYIVNNSINHSSEKNIGIYRWSLHISQ